MWLYSNTVALSAVATIFYVVIGCTKVPGIAETNTPLPLRSPCPANGWAAGKALISNPTTAVDVFLAVEQSIEPDAKRSRFPDVMAWDKADHWSVSRGRVARQFLFWREDPIYGGGQLMLNIAKCDGRITAVALSE